MNDLADLIESYLWDECNDEDLDHLASISDAATQRWVDAVRELLERYGINRYFDSNGTVRKQGEADPASPLETEKGH